jgi:hypothetical protein
MLATRSALAAAGAGVCDTAADVVDAVVVAATAAAFACDVGEVVVVVVDGVDVLHLHTALHASGSTLPTIFPTPLLLLLLPTLCLAPIWRVLSKIR